MKNLMIVSRDSQFFASCFHQNVALQEHFRLIFAGSEPLPEQLKQAEIIIGEPDLVSRHLPLCVNVQWVQSTWAGNNKLQALAKKDYVLTGVKGVFGLQMVEYVMSYILYFTRRIEEFNQLKVKREWSQLVCKPLSEYRVGIMGMGSIGKHLAAKLSDMGMPINGLSRSRNSIPNVSFYTDDNLTDFLQSSDFVINLLPETEVTVGYCDASFFDAMKKGSIFINAGRGSVVDKPQSIAKVLNERTLHAAVLDVFEQEPLPATHIYYSTPNLYISCHTAAISDPQKVFDLFAINALHFVHQEPLLYLHDFQRGY